MSLPAWPNCRISSNKIIKSNILNWITCIMFERLIFIPAHFVHSHIQISPKQKSFKKVTLNDIVKLEVKVWINWNSQTPFSTCFRNLALRYFFNVMISSILSTITIVLAISIIAPLSEIKNIRFSKLFLQIELTIYLRFG